VSGRVKIQNPAPLATLGSLFGSPRILILWAISDLKASLTLTGTGSLLLREVFPMLGRWLSALILVPLLLSFTLGKEPAPLKLLFLGDNGHHKPYDRYRQLQMAMSKRGIEIEYTDNLKALDPKILENFDGLIVFANIDELPAAQEKALLDYVNSGKGFLPLHCASFCFRNSKAYVDLVGAQFKSHTTGIFRTVLSEANHPITKGYTPFESWDETYVHSQHNEKDRTVLEYRIEGNQKEPWTWVRTPGKARVFYTAWGHDERTWSNPGFLNLVERGIRWSCGKEVSDVPAYRDEPPMTPISKDLKAFEYVDANIPFYPPSKKWGVLAEPIKKMQKPVSAEESMKHVSVPEGFELKLFVDENTLKGKPLVMNWDERGRLWVVLTQDYPNEMQTPGKGRDRIVICEDTNGDGKADQVKTFADKLSIPTSFCFANGGIIVAQAPDMLFLKDTNGDDVCDERKVLFTGWLTNDTHAGPSNLKYGFDNWIYGMVGYAGFEGAVGGERKSFRQGFYRFKPDGSKIEFLRNTNNNSWGVGFSEEGFLFGSTANGCPSVYLPIPNRYYEAVQGWSSSVLPNIAFENRYRPITEKVRQVDWHGGFTSAAGHSLYTARTYPKEYWNRTAFVSDPTGHLTATFILQENGSDFRSRYGWNLVAGDDEWFAPISAEVGPDGNMWVLDWYNYIVQHNPTPQGFKTGKGNAYETELRDKTHGRIYRIVHKDSKPTPPLSLKGLGEEKLVETLKHPNLFWRQHAQRLLVEGKKKEAIPALMKLLADESVDELGLNVGVIHALWTLQGMGGLDFAAKGQGDLIFQLLDHPSPAVRRAALLAYPKTEKNPGVFTRVKQFKDPDMHVRLAAFLALAEMTPNKNAAFRIVDGMKSRENMVDRWIPDALVASAAKHDEFFLQAITQAEENLDERGLALLSIVAEHYARSAPIKSVGTLIAKLEKSDPRVAETILASLAKGWPRNKAAELSPADEKALVSLLPKLSATGKSNLLRLTATWGNQSLSKYTEEIATSLLKTALDETQKDDARLNSVKQFVDLRGSDEAGLKQLLGAITPRSSPMLASGIIDALSNAKTELVGPALLSRFPTLSPASRSTALKVLLSRTESTRLLLNAIEKGQIGFTELTLNQKQSLASNSDQEISARAKKLLAAGGGLPSADRQKVIEELHDLLKKTGNAGLGKEMFKKHCSACHQHSGEGNRVGPDLTGMNVHPKEELLVHILDPNRSVEGNFRLYKVVTLDGKQLEGMLLSETNTSIELIDPQAKKSVILRDDIETLTASNKSLMPEGFEKQMTPEEMSNLLEFLTQRGKYLPIPLDKVATIVTTKGMFFDDAGPTERLILRDWNPRTVEEVPFLLVDPQGEKSPNAILLYGPEGLKAPKMPKSVTVPCNAPAKAIHLLSGVSGWGFPVGTKGSVSMIVRLHLDDGKTEDHELKNGIHFADYIRRVDVPESKFAFSMRNQQMRFLTVTPKSERTITKIEFVKGADNSAPIVLAVTVETR
jgi:putative membrane-bound dehydrogenase-like protein